MKFYRDLFITFRESRRFSQEDLAKKLGVSKQAVQQWEDGTCRPRPANVYAAAKTLGISVVDISDLKAESWLKKPENPFLQIILDCWDKLTPEDQGRLAGIVRGMVESKPAPARKLHCPICHAELPAEWKDGETNECPNCKQHIRIE